MRANQASFPVRLMCRVLGVSPSGYYAWSSRGPSLRAVTNGRLRERMREIHQLSRETYGRPRMQAELRDEGWGVNHKRVARLVKLEGLEGASRRRKWRTQPLCGTWTTRVPPLSHLPTVPRHANATERMEPRRERPANQLPEHDRPHDHENQRRH